MTGVSIEVADHQRSEVRDLSDLARELQELVVAPERMVSLHLDCDWRDEQQRERARLFVKTNAARLAKVDPDLAPDLDHAVALAQSLAKREFDEEYAGVAGFFCEGLDVDLVVRLHRPLENRLSVGSRPLVGPILRALSDAPPALVAVTSREDTRVWELLAGHAAGREVIRRDVPNRHSRGGWAQLRIQHHIDEHATEQLRAAAEAIVRRFDDLGGAPLVLVAGPPEPLGELRRLLPPRLSERLRNLDGIGRYDGEARILDAASELLAQCLAQKRAELLQTAKDGAKGGGRGAIGVAAVVEAINRKRIERLLQHDRFRADGARCDDCGTLSEKPVDVCPVCDSETEIVRLEDALPEAAVNLSAPLEMIHGDSPLADVAALLRY